MTTLMNEQRKDLSSCCVCYDTYDDKTLKRKPKYLCIYSEVHLLFKCTKVNKIYPPIFDIWFLHLTFSP